MTPNQKLFAIRSFKSIPTKGDPLELVKSALKRRYIDFFTATELADQVKAGRGAEVIRALNELTGKPVTFDDLLEFDPTDN